MEIIWTDKAIFDLKQIFDFLSSRSESAAKKETEKIFLKVSFLETGFSKIGQEEPLLKSYKKKYRYLVSGNHKIIYSISTDKIFIHTIFDTRQNPKKLKTRK